MTWLASNKPSVVTPVSTLLSRTFAPALFLALIGSFGFIMAATADVIFDRKAGFKENVESMKAIAAAIGGGDYATVIDQAKSISNWAQKIPGYFPEGSGSGRTKARAEIWVNFDDFTARAKANENSAERLIKAAKSVDLDATMAALKNLGGSCKACHKFYKN